MWLKYLGILGLFFMAAFIQYGFLGHLGFLGLSINLIFIVFFTLIFFEKQQQYAMGLYSALVGGFLIDALSPYYFGTAILSFLITYALFKLATAFLKERQEKYVVVYYIVLALVFFGIYYGIWSMAVNLLHQV